MAMTFTETADGRYASELGLRFESKDKGTNWLSIVHEEEDEATKAIVADFLASGWELPRFRGAPPLEGVTETTLSKKGTDLFGGWSDAERKANMKEARAILRRHGITGVDLHQLTWQECI